MEIYKHKTVEQLETFYGDLLVNIDEYGSLKDHLAVLASKMWEGVQVENEAVLNQISNYHWKHLGKDAKGLLAAKLKEEDCRQAIANEYGFRRWTEVGHLRAAYNVDFEKTINAMLCGDLSGVQQFIEGNRDLINLKSQYGHKATLLHYAASNGVEMWRQKVPLNLPEIVAYLIEQGANKRAKMKVYGGEYTAAELLPSSAHPREAGVAAQLRKLL